MLVTDGRTDRQLDRPSYSDTKTQLKIVLARQRYRSTFPEWQPLRHRAPISCSVAQSILQSVSSTIDQSNDRLLGLLVSHSVDRSFDLWLRRSVGRSINRSASMLHWDLRISTPLILHQYFGLSYVRPGFYTFLAEKHFKNLRKKKISTNILTFIETVANG